MNSNIKIGEKIKKRRNELGLTQNEVAGSFMTRNMLSMIESGEALPSIENAERLAAALSVPLSFLFSENDDIFPYEKNQKLSYIKDLFKKGNYKHCLAVLDSLSSSDDETNYIYANAAFCEGKRLLFSGSLTSAETYLKAALAKCQETDYDTTYISASIPLYLSVALNIQSPLLELDTSSYENFHASEDYEFFKYLTMDREYNFKNKIYSNHLYAKFLIKQYNYSEALKILVKLQDSKENNFNAYALFGIYTDLEYIYKQQGDFENAYRYSAKRISLISAFNS